MKRTPSRTGVLCRSALAVLWFLPAAQASTQPVTAVAFNRFYFESPKDQAQVHFYRTGMEVPKNWRFEGIEGYVSPVPRPYTVPLHRFYFDDFMDHFYTASEGERAGLKGGGWTYVYEGVAGYVVPAERDIPGTVPLYRFTRQHYFNGMGDGQHTYDHPRWYQDHFYSLSPTLPPHYTAEGICCRVWKEAVQLPDTLLKMSVPPQASSSVVSAVLGLGGTTGESGPHPNVRWVKGSTQTIGWEIWNGGGIIQLSYSSNGGQSWSVIGEVLAGPNHGVVTNGSYTWSLPPTLTGTIRIKLDWSSNPGKTIPWASVQSADVVVAGVIRVAPRRK